MGRKAQVRRVRQLRAILTQQRIAKWRPSRRARLQSRPNPGWPLVATGLVAGFLAGSLPLHKLASRLISFGVLGLRAQRMIQALVRHAE